MTKKDFDRICMDLVEIARGRAPKDTRNLADNGIRYYWEDEGTFVIYVDGDGKNGIAPYMPFTNEKWISPKWNGKQNPNEGWWQDTVQLILDYIINELNGEIEK